MIREIKRSNILWNVELYSIYLKLLILDQAKNCDENIFSQINFINNSSAIL